MSYLPRPDSQLINWTTNFMTYAEANLEALGLTVLDMGDIAAKAGGFQAAHAANLAAQQAAQTARQAKDTARAELTATIRSLVRQIQARPAVTDEQRVGLGITVPDGSSDTVAISATRPVAVIDTSERFRHEIRFTDASTPTRRGKPSGVTGCEIWVKVGSPPADEGELGFLAIDTASPYVAEYDMAQAGQTAYYMLRWVSSDGQKGPWSETAAATITA